MFGGGELKNLEMRRRELVLQSTLNRLAIRTEVRNLRVAIQPAERVVNSVRTIRPWLTLLAPIAGLLVAGRGRSTGSLLGKTLAVLRWIQPILSLLKQLKAGSNGAGTEEPQAPRTPSLEP